MVLVREKHVYFGESMFAATLTFLCADPAYPLTCSNPCARLAFFFKLSETINPKILKPYTLKP
jgi:hypothetical protein